MYLDGVLYVHKNYAKSDLPKEFKKYAWCFDSASDPDIVRGVLT